MKINITNATIRNLLISMTLIECYAIDISAMELAEDIKDNSQKLVKNLTANSDSCLLKNCDNLQEFKTIIWIGANPFISTKFFDKTTDLKYFDNLINELPNWHIKIAPYSVMNMNEYLTKGNHVIATTAELQDVIDGKIIILQLSNRKSPKISKFHFRKMLSDQNVLLNIAELPHLIRVLKDEYELKIHFCEYDKIMVPAFSYIIKKK
jgi:hypothetical protein